MAAPRSSLEDRVKLLEDIEAIKRLKHEYCSALDRRDWDAVVETFARDGTVDYGDIGRARGRKAIRKLFVEKISKDFALFVHMAHNPIIDVDGEKARGRWYFDIPATVAPDRARWIVGWYDDEYVREGGRWRYASLSSSYFYVSSYEKGWGKERFVGENRPAKPATGAVRAGEYLRLLGTNPRLNWAKVPGEPEGTTEVVLHRHSDGSYSHLLRIEKGVVIPDVVVHDFYEEAYYLEGEILNTKTGETITGGMYVFHEPGEEHGPFRVQKTCLILEFRYYK